MSVSFLLFLQLAITIVLQRIEMCCTFLCQYRLADLVGFGVAVATATQYIEHFPDRTYKSMIVPLMQEDKRAGSRVSKMEIPDLILNSHILNGLNIFVSLFR